MVIAEIIFGIVFVICIVGGVLGSKYLQIQREQLRRDHSLGQEFGARLARLETLEKRVAVLEQIVTDKRYDLNEQFRNLEKAG
ncbi:MAG: hypothetical protein OER80_09355 [Gammaproteobacteria bacterium]|nr:hypothetical protein [Gammaproteobacteria bacterium]MDH3768352.1 hypothetical protein [Gammaproteobacteria bacterium]